MEQGCDLAIAGLTAHGITGKRSVRDLRCWTKILSDRKSRSSMNLLDRTWSTNFCGIGFMHEDKERASKASRGVGCKQKEGVDENEATPSDP